MFNNALKRLRENFSAAPSTNKNTCDCWIATADSRVPSTYEPTADGTWMGANPTQTVEAAGLPAAPDQAETTRTAQILYSGCFEIGSTASVVIRLHIRSGSCM